MHDNMVELVERMLDLHKQAGLTVVQRGPVEAQIEATDREIDKLVYRLYGLTDDEMQLWRANDYPQVHIGLNETRLKGIF